MAPQELRPIQNSAPDVRSSAFKEEALRQSRAISAAPDESDTLDFLEDIQDFGDEPSTIGAVFGRLDALS